jgi:DNA-binding transcriptional LysR family regulator
MTTEPTRVPFRIGVVPGVTLSKWSRLWEERRPETPLAFVPLADADAVPSLDDARGDDRVDMVLARLPIEVEGLSVIRLYDERAVVVVPKDHAVAAVGAEDEVEGAVFADEHRHDLDPSLSLADAVAVVATGVGVAVMPQSLARLHARKEVTYRYVADLPPTTIALVWPEGELTDDLDDFIGVVRGRTARSSRSRRRDEPEQAATARTGSAPDPRGAKPKRTPPKGRGPQRGTGRSRPRRGR